MSTIDQDQEPAFARGIAGPLGKLTEDLKTKVDEVRFSAHRGRRFRLIVDAVST